MTHISFLNDLEIFPAISYIDDLVFDFRKPGVGASFIDGRALAFRFRLIPSIGSPERA